jgi:hypothetical protein
LGIPSPAIRKLFFNGADYSVFSKIGPSYSVYMPNGRLMGKASRLALERHRLIPGVYIVRQEKGK